MKVMSLQSMLALIRGASSALVVAMLLILAPSGYAQGAVGPFSGMSGAWAGDGIISLKDGSRERIRCRAQYAVGDAGQNLQMELRCASDSYKFELKSDVKNDGGAISGIWNEALRNAAGYVSGRARTGQIAVKVDSPAFSADLTVHTRGDKQSVTIRSPDSQILEVAINLQKRA
jgi:hypothetical protein